ncbi:hypothetical protein [Streptomyces vietnamensis]|uniref:Uncharacterized protein n=1 Tax=Streptomyces vietnamensis TaxID=362257 RepID=A0A0B5I6I6_9ACTN|nr:hypothetical protein [Streptomyces vietnamensis]AJF68176.1 hypothetical protein SVTN_31245 [Streptomyces vietnamensis]
MNAFRQYFEDNPEIFAALVAAIAIVGGLLGSIIGAKIQANGGRDQAAAAREAAQIAAEAQRVANLWTVRQVQLADFVHGVREVQRIQARFYIEDSSDGALTAQLDDAEQVVSRRAAEISLVAPAAVVAAAAEVREGLMDESVNAFAVGSVFYVRHLLDLRAISDDSWEVAAAEQAIEAVEEYLRSRDQDDASVRATAQRRAYDAVREVTGLPGVLVADVLPALTTRVSEMAVERNRCRQNIEGKVDRFIAVAREMLRSEDDVAPAAPEQRRRWWRAA